MKKFFFTLALSAVVFIADAQTMVGGSSTYKIVTVVESIIPGGLGRSRMLETVSEVDYNQFTTERTDGKDSKQKEVDRGDIKIAGFKETKLLNFFSMVGINFQNIASNDAVVISKLNEMDAQGYELIHIASGVESDAGKDDGQGLFITRFYFKKK